MIGCAQQLMRRMVCHAGREIRESMFDQVSDLIHALDAGMMPISVFFPYLPIPAHNNRDR